MRTAPRAEHLKLKAFFRDLVSACGGVVRASSITSHPDSHLSAMGAAHVEDRWPRVDHVIDLEADCGVPIVTRFLADLHGCDVVPRAVEATPASVHQMVARIARESAEVQASLIEGLADGRLTEAERAAVTTEAQQAINELHALIAALKSGLKVVKA